MVFAKSTAEGEAGCGRRRQSRLTGGEGKNGDKGWCGKVHEHGSEELETAWKGVRTTGRKKSKDG